MTPPAAEAGPQQAGRASLAPDFPADFAADGSEMRGAVAITGFTSSRICRPHGEVTPPGASADLCPRQMWPAPKPLDPSRV